LQLLRTPLHIAAEMNFHAVVHALLLHGKANVFVRDAVCLYLTCSLHTRALTHIIGAFYLSFSSQDFKTPLMLAAKYGCDEVVVTILRESKVDVNAVDRVRPFLLL
jgi:ankyrin repeat protein